MLNQRCNLNDQSKDISGGSSNPGLFSRGWWILAGAFGACLLPLSLLLDFRNTFYVDWFNHLWSIEYFGEYMKWHRTPPDVFITTSLVGIPMPIFYGGKFYALAGCLSALLGSAAAFRAVAMFAMLIQFVHVQRAVHSVNPSKCLSFAIALLVSWAIYPLTNLYNRSALTEFIAVALLNAAMCCLFVLLIKLSLDQRSYYDAVAVGLFYALAAVTHPLTALFGCMFILVIGIGALLVLRLFWLVIVGAANAVLIAIILAPWCYAVHRFSGLMFVDNPAHNSLLFRRLDFFRDTIDSFWSRLSPMPVDLRSISKGVEVSTPYLDAQIILPLVLLFGLLSGFWFISGQRVCRRKRTLLVVILSLSTGFALLFFAVSVHPSLSARFYGLFDILQFPYRLTAYVNLALLTAVMALAGLIDWNRETRGTSLFRTVGITLCVTISLCALISQLVHANAANHLIQSETRPDSQVRWYPGLFGRGPRLLDLPWTSYSQFQYSVLVGLATTRPKGFENDQSIAFLPGDLSRFGKVNSITIDLLAPTLVVTNVQPFPWNVLIVDGKLQSPHDLVTALSGAFPNSNNPKALHPLVVATPLMPGRHVLQYRFVPEQIWRILNISSWVALMLWALIWLASAVWFSRRPKFYPGGCAPQ
jgi:hypothetical protein